MFSTTGIEDTKLNYGLPGDDAIRFMFFWIETFCKVREFYEYADIEIEYEDNIPEGQYWNLKNYVDYLEANKIISHVEQLPEQRTFIDERVKKTVILRMTKYFKDFFGENSKIFEYIEDWHDYKRQTKKITLVNVDGVFHLKTPKGECFWAWSNTSAKIGFGAQCKNKKDLLELVEILFSIYLHCRIEVGQESKLNLAKLGDTETGVLQKLFKKKSGLQVENYILEGYKTINDSLNGLLDWLCITKDSVEKINTKDSIEQKTSISS